jgi:hypothetical protein
MEHRWNETDTWKLKYLGGKTCLSATFSTTNPTWTDPGSNPDLRGERPATNRLSHDTATKNQVTKPVTTTARYKLHRFMYKTAIDEISKLLHRQGLQ